MMKSGHYSIPLTGLKEGSHIYEFEIDKDFFDLFEGSEITKGELVAYATLVKRSAHMELVLKVTGLAEVVCDRCLEPYLQRVDTEGRLLVKFGEQFEEIDDEVFIIPAGESRLDLAQLIYEYAHLGLPLQRLHPDDEEGYSGCDPDMLDRIGGYTEEWEEENDNTKPENIDPRWKDLGKLKEDLLN